MAMTYGTIYVASVAMGAKDEHTLKAFLEAEAYDGPAIIIAYSHCIAHGINMTTAMQNQKAAVNYGAMATVSLQSRAAPARRKSASARFRRAAHKAHGLLQARDSGSRCSRRANPRAARELLDQAQADVNARRAFYEFLATQKIQHHTKPMNLTTRYLGFKLRTPLVPSASPLSEKIDNIKRMEDAGAAAVVFHSLSKSRFGAITTTSIFISNRARKVYAESLTYFPVRPEFKVGPEAYLEHIAQAKAAVRYPDHRQPQRQRLLAAG